MSLAGALFLLLAASSQSEPPSTVIFPAQEMGIKFNHRFHVDEISVPCEKCHVAAPTSALSADKLIPREEACADCHEDVKRDGGKCEKCHATADPPSLMGMPAAHLRFPHKTHVDEGIECTRCHAGVPGVELATRNELPRMALCLTCHDGRQAPDACTTCHLGAGGGRVRTRYAEGTLKPRSHDAQWWRSHRAAGRMDDPKCRACHQEADCMECHRGGRLVRGAVIKPQFHPNDWILLHPRAAYADDPSCSSCHARQTFCRDCHEGHKLGLGINFPGKERLFHPLGWAELTAGPNHHSHQARRSIAACASCHREETCLECHSTRTLAFNPHPKNFDPTALKRSGRAMCERCHEPSDPRLR